MNEQLKFFKKLTEADGIGGHEREVRDILAEEFLKVVSKEDISFDGLGSIIARQSSQVDGPKIVLAGHMDEVGMIVTKITDEGFLKFQPIGGWWSQVMLAQEVTITTSDNKKYRGVTGSKPPHILSPEERKNPVKIEDIFIDLGVKDKAEVEELGIKVGDMITPKLDFQVLANEKYLLSKAWDNRVGCAITIDVMKNLKDCDHPNVVYGVGTVQEEIGLRGARTSAQKINPDIVFALDVGIAKDTPGTDNSSKMGDGPQILLYDGSLVGHVGLREFVVGVADELKIPYQLDTMSRGGTDAGAMHLAHDGAPAMAVCIPSRYIHSHTSMIHKDDYDNAVKLLTEVIKRLDEKKVHDITYK